MRGDGSVFKTTNNGKAKWAYRWNQAGRTHTKFFPGTEEGKRQAEDFKKVKRVELQDGIKGCASSLHDAIVDYLETHKLNDIRPSSYQRHIDTLYAIPAWLRTDKRIDEITADDVKKGLNEVGERLSKSSTRKVYDLINATMKNAVANKKLRDNPMATLKRPQIEKAEKEVFTDSEIFRLLRTARYIQTAGKFHSITHDYYTIILLLLTTGLRIGEALALRWEDIDWTDGKEEIHIQRTLDSHFINKNKNQKGLQRFNEPKTNKGDRYIPIFSKHLVKRLKDMRPSEDAKGQVFSTRTGTALSYHNFVKTWSAIGKEYARKCPHCGHRRPNDWTCPNGHHVTRRRVQCPVCKAEQPKEWTCPDCGTLVKELHKSPHTTRHTFVSYLLNHGVPIKYVQALAGHADSTVTIGTYGHAPQHLRDGVKSTFRK
jgi:integrase